MGVDEECNCGYVKSEVFWGHLSGDGGQAISGVHVQGSGEQVKLEMEMWASCLGMVRQASCLHAITRLPDEFSLPELFFLSLQVYRFMAFFSLSCSFLVRARSGICVL